MCNSDREKAINAVDLLNDFVGDFITGTMSLAQYHAEHNSGTISAEQLVGINKMCLSHLILSLTKWAEFYKKFHQLIPDEYKDNAKQIIKIIESRKVIEFRNKCVGHIWDKDTNRPLVNSEIMARLDTIANKDIKGFLRWLNNPNPAEFQNSVAGICEAIRDKIAAVHKIAPGDAIQR